MGQPRRYRPDPIYQEDGTIKVPVFPDKWTILDIEDEWALEYPWRLHGKGYACSNTKSLTSPYLHRAILDAPAGLQVDHRDLDRLNNRRSNLRLATPSENQRNRRGSAGKTSRYRGVFRHSQTRSWCAQITDQTGRTIHLGCFAVEEDAAEAYANAAIEHHGEFARYGPTDSEGIAS